MTEIFTTAITKAELLYGVHLLPQGKRRRLLDDAVNGFFDRDLAGKVLAFDASAATHYAEIVPARRAAGRPISQSDAQIAAIVGTQGAVLATRNVEDFAYCSLKIVDPWSN